jgi:SAM-dependent methyltransferase
MSAAYVSSFIQIYLFIRTYMSALVDMIQDYNKPPGKIGQEKTGGRLTAPEGCVRLSAPAGFIPPVVIVLWDDGKSPMTGTVSPWDKDYVCRGRLYGGSAPPLPGMPASARLLEIGCGDGKTVSQLVQKGFPVTALDRSPPAVSLCRRVCTDPDRLRLVVADGTQAPFRSGSFDAVIAFHVTGHLPEGRRRKLAAEIQRLLVPGGTFYFRDFSVRDFRYGKGGVTEPDTFIRKNGIITHYFTGTEICSLFTGLVVRRLEHHAWEMRIRGRAFLRDELVAEFQKPG